MKVKILSLFAVFMMVITQNGNAQVKIPPASSSQTITQSLGVSTITLTYSRPNMNGRKIFENGKISFVVDIMG